MLHFKCFKCNILRTLKCNFKKLNTINIASLVAQMVKNLSAMQEMRVQSLGSEDSVKEGMEPTPVFLPGESSLHKGPGGLQSMGPQSQTRLSD